MTNEEKILDILAAMQGESSALRSDVNALRGDVDALRGDMDALRSDMNTQFTKVEGDITKVNIKLENVIEPKITALGEGQKSILEMLAPRSRVDDLEEEIKMLKVSMR